MTGTELIHREMYFTEEKGQIYDYGAKVHLNTKLRSSSHPCKYFYLRQRSRSLKNNSSAIHIAPGICEKTGCNTQLQKTTSTTATTLGSAYLADNSIVTKPEVRFIQA